VVRAACKPQWERIGTIDHPLKGLTAFSLLLIQENSFTPSGKGVMEYAWSCMIWVMLP
jgi:hypothetical protein